MTTWTRIFGGIKGGWKTWGPNAIAGSGAFDIGDNDPLYEAVSVNAAMKLSAYKACIELRAETLGSLPLHLRDANKKVVTDHPLYSILHDSPNAYMTAPEYWSWCTQAVDNVGNALSIIQRRRDKSVISLEPIQSCDTSIEMLKRKSGALYYKIGQEEYPADDILHLRGFSTNPLWGLSRLDIGKYILGAQLAANESAMRAFRGGLKIGGFFEMDHNLTTDQLADLRSRLDDYSQSKNAGRWMTLLKGMKPVSGNDFRVKPAEAELLQSRYFGIEEICRLCSTPPQLIGHTDKASSWASSIENINLYFLMYSMQPTFIRYERRIEKSLVPVQDRGRLNAKFAIGGLLRASQEVQSKMFASALEHGYYNVNEVRDMLDRMEIEGGDEYRVYANTGVGAKEDNTGDTKK